VRRLASLAAAVVLVLGTASTAIASHSWAEYHWSRSANPLSLVVASNLTSNWSSYFGTAVGDWDDSSVLALTTAEGAHLKGCGAVSGRVEVCNGEYGYRNGGWLGIAQIWLSGGHIVQGTVKVNDTFLSGGGTYDSDAWRQMVICQEIGHTFGLDHQDENFYNANLGTCMDYTNNPASNQHPNAHDYAQLEDIYAHLDGTGGGGGGGGGNCPPHKPGCAGGGFPSFAQAGREHGSLYVDRAGAGLTRITHVLWLPSRR
jgi:hypothetical protein